MGKGCLYIVPVPVGNLGDITLRAIEVLKEVDFVIAEDTRRSLKLLNHLGIRKSILSYYKPKEREKASVILKRLETQNAALISDSGTPLISDPGLFLITKVIKRGIPIVPLPGPTAFVPALTASGLETGCFLFLGFPPRKEGDLKRFLEANRNQSATMIFYESPRRLRTFLKVAFDILGNRSIALCREISKINETIIRDELKNWIGILETIDTRGEMVLVIEGNSRVTDVDQPQLESLDDIYEYFKKFKIPKRKIKEIIWKSKKE